MNVIDSNWYIGKEGKRLGPFTWVQLTEMVQQGRLSSEDLIWKEGRNDWTKAGIERGLFDGSPSLPPPLPSSNQFALPRCTYIEGVIFCEREIPGVKVLNDVKVAIHGLFAQAQLKTLTDVKTRLAKNAAAIGANCVQSFKYGQRSGFWSWFLGLDDVSWYGSGIACVADTPLYDRIIAEVSRSH